MDGRIPRSLRAKSKEAIPPNLRWHIWERDNFTCHYCGSRKHLAVDHKIPESKGGLLEPSNLLTSCMRCNSRKGTKSYEFFLLELHDLVFMLPILGNSCQREFIRVPINELDMCDFISVVKSLLKKSEFLRAKTVYEIGVAWFGGRFRLMFDNFD